MAAREGWAAITGDTAPERRQEIVDSFQAGELRGVALTIAAGGVGLTLTRASDVLFVDRAWNPADNVQAEDRAHRIGQANAVKITVLTSDNVLDARVNTLIEEKFTLIDAAIEGRTEISESDVAAAKARAEAQVEAAAKAKDVADRAETEALAALLSRETERAERGQRVRRLRSRICPRSNARESLTPCGCS